MDAIYDRTKNPAEDNPNSSELMELKEDTKIENMEEHEEVNEENVTYLKRIFGSDLKLSDKGKKLINKKKHLFSIFEKGLSFRQKVQRIIESNYFQVTIIILVLIDTLLCGIELVVIIQHNDDECSKSNMINGTYISSTINPKVNDKKSTYFIHRFLKYTALVILGIFLIEILLKLIFNTCAFIKSKLELLDSAIIIVSFVLDIMYFDDNVPFQFCKLTIKLCFFEFSVSDYYF